MNMIKSATVDSINFKLPSESFNETKCYLKDLIKKGFFFHEFNLDNLGILHSLDPKLKLKMLKLFKSSEEKTKHLIKVGIALQKVELFKKAQRAFDQVVEENKLSLKSGGDADPLMNYFNSPKVDASLKKIIGNDLTRIFNREQFTSPEEKVAYEKILGEMMTVIQTNDGPKKKMEFLTAFLDSSIGQVKERLIQSAIELFSQKLPYVEADFIRSSFRSYEGLERILLLLHFCCFPRKMRL